MEPVSETRADRKRRAVLLAATDVFLEKGYDSTSMDDVAAKAGVSKPTVYKYFSDKERLFAEIVSATTSDVNDLVQLVSEALAGQQSVEQGLTTLASRFLTVLMQPRILQLRRLVMANADRFPDVGRSWYEQGFQRALTTLALSFQGLAERELLQIEDPLLAANHFVGMLLWIPVNRAMFTGNHRSSADELERAAQAAVRAFLTGYGSTGRSSARAARPTRKKSV